MVLQRDLPVPIWGWADPNEIVSVSFDGQIKETKANTQGKWMVKLDKLSANFKPALRGWPFLHGETNAPDSREVGRDVQAAQGGAETHH